MPNTPLDKLKVEGDSVSVSDEKFNLSVVVPTLNHPNPCPPLAPLLSSLEVVKTAEDNVLVSVENVNLSIVEGAAYAEVSPPLIQADPAPVVEPNL